MDAAIAGRLELAAAHAAVRPAWRALMETADAATGRRGAGALGVLGGDRSRDEVLVRRAQRGDEGAFGLLYETHADRVYRFVRWKVGADVELARDLTADTWLRALRGIGSFRHANGDFGAWLLRIARNVVTDHWRRAARRGEVMTGDVPDVVDLRDGVDPVEAVEAVERAAAVRAALRALRPVEQDVLTLRFVADLSLTQTASVMGRSVPAVKMAQHRALRSLAGQLARRGVTQ